MSHSCVCCKHVLLGESNTVTLQPKDVTGAKVPRLTRTGCFCFPRQQEEPHLLTFLKRWRVGRGQLHCPQGVSLDGCVFPHLVYSKHTKCSVLYTIWYNQISSLSSVGLCHLFFVFGFEDIYKELILNMSGWEITWFYNFVQCCITVWAGCMIKKALKLYTFSCRQY